MKQTKRATTTKQPQLSSFTPSSAHLFRQTRVFYIHTHPSPSSTLASLSPFSNSNDNQTRIDVFDITAVTFSRIDSKTQLDLLRETNLKPHEITNIVPKLDHLARECEMPFLKLTKGAWYHRFFVATSPSQKEDEDEEGGSARGEVVARLDGPLLDMGHWKLTFPPAAIQAGTNHGLHDVELKPTGPGSNTDVFFLNSVPYIWEIVKAREVFRLWSCGMAGDGHDGGKGVRREVGVYIARNSRSAGREGVLVLDDGHADGVEGAREGDQEGKAEGVDVLVGIMTCLGTVNRSDSFRK